MSLVCTFLFIRVLIASVTVLLQHLWLLTCNHFISKEWVKPTCGFSFHILFMLLFSSPPKYFFYNSLSSCQTLCQPVFSKRLLDSHKLQAFPFVIQPKALDNGWLQMKLGGHGWEFYTVMFKRFWCLRVILLTFSCRCSKWFF